MPSKPYDWSNGPAELQAHSLTKLKVLREYIISYCLARTVIPKMKKIKLTLIDGFAGGGSYQHNDEQVDGSPLVCLKAIKEAEFLINEKRDKPIKLDVDFIFIEKNKSAFQFLEYTLKHSEYQSQLNKNIHIIHGTFQDNIDDLIQRINQKSPRTGHSLFLLDQYGYKEIPTYMIQKILGILPKSEIILTFYIDALLARVNENITSASLNKLGLDGINILQDHQTTTRQILQQRVLTDLINKCRAPFFTPFFIRNSDGYGDYWLIHMSKHVTARNVMIETHYKYFNYFIHYGDAGLDMFGYNPKADPGITKQNSFIQVSDEFDFSLEARQKSIAQIAEEMPHYLSRDGIRFKSFVEKTCNNTPATKDMYRESLNELLACKEIEVIGKNGEKRQKGSNIKDSDIIKLPAQCKFIF